MITAINQSVVSYCNKSVVTSYYLEVSHLIHYYFNCLVKTNFSKEISCSQCKTFFVLSLFFCFCFCFFFSLKMGCQNIAKTWQIYVNNVWKFQIFTPTHFSTINTERQSYIILDKSRSIVWITELPDRSRIGALRVN